MKAVVLVKNGSPKEAFKIQTVADPEPSDTQVRIAVEAFGLNFADVMARQGHYQDCPPLPTVIGYEAVGIIDKLGSKVAAENRLKVGQRVLAFTRFGAYAEKVVTESTGVVPIPNDMSIGVATALATQYCTAYYAAEIISPLQEGEQVMIQSAAGGVGTALVQLAKRHNCTIYGTAGSAEKLKYLKEQGVDYPINYRTEDFAKRIKGLAPHGKIDVMFDAVGGNAVKKGMKLLGAGGRMVCYGASSLSGRSVNVFQKLKTVAGFGFYHPVQFMMSSKALIGVNMLRIADNKPHILQKCLESVVALAEKGDLKPTVGGVFAIEQLNEAHEQLEFRKSIGKIVVHW